MMVRIVLQMRQNSYHTILGKKRGLGTQGSVWFLDSLEKNRRLADTPMYTDLERDEARAITFLALNSVHYMTEELRLREEALSRDEWRDTGFIHLMCDYLSWLDYFHMKFLRVRAQMVRPRFSQVKLAEGYAKAIQEIVASRDRLLKVRSESLGRRATAERMRQVRLGAVFPILATAGSLLLYICLQPLSYNANASLDELLVATAYALGSSTIAVNLAFGLWLLVPDRTRLPASLVY
jgi:hypothetical protein